MLSGNINNFFFMVGSFIFIVLLIVAPFIIVLTCVAAAIFVLGWLIYGLIKELWEKADEWSGDYPRND